MSANYFKLPSNAEVETLVARAEAARRLEVRALFGRMFRSVAATLRLFEQALVCAREARALYELSDRELARRGISRGDIGNLVARNLDQAVPRGDGGGGESHANDDRLVANTNASQARVADDRAGKAA